MIRESIPITELIKPNSKNIYCFGAGKAFDSFFGEFAQYQLEKYVKGIVDNNADNMAVSVKKIDGIKIPVISLQQMLDAISEKDCILITTAAYEEVVQQLEKIPKLTYTKCYLYKLMRVEQYDYDRLHVSVPEKLSIYEEIQIPKTIHYCWFGKNKIPDQYWKWMESWKHYCPDYEIIEWNEDNYDVNKSRYISQAYDMKKWAFVSDYARIDIINEYGGVYLDTDVELIKSLDELLKNDAFCGFESCQYVAYGLGFGAKKNNKILQEMKEYYDNTCFVKKDGTLNEISCPVIQTDVMKRHGLECNGEFQLVDGMTVYPVHILCGMSPYSLKIERDLKNTYAVHHYAASWVENRQEGVPIILQMKKWFKNDNYAYDNEPQS